MRPKGPILLAIVGDSAAGKTTISKGIEKILGSDQVTNICVDDYHKYNRIQRKERNITALHPDCNYIDIIEQHIRLLRTGKPILKPVYNHSTGDFDPPEYVQPKNFVILEGLLPLYTRRMRDTFDVKIYLDPEEDLRIAWKIKRDTSKRGYTKEEVLRALKKREHDAATYIKPQRTYADIVMNFHRPEGNTEETGGHLNVKLVLRPTIPNPDLSVFIDESREDDKKCLSLSLGRDEGRPVDFLHIAGNTPVNKAKELEDVIWSHLPDFEHLRESQIGEFYDGLETKVSYPLALSQLLIAYHLLYAQKITEK